MVRKVKLRQADGSVSAPIAKNMPERLLLDIGDRVLAIGTDQGILLTPYNADVEAGLAVAARAAGKFRNALRVLAK